MSDDADLKKKEAFAKKPDTTGAVKVSRPQNGAEYLDSLRDDREVYPVSYTHLTLPTNREV